MELVNLVAPGPGHAPAEQTTILVKWHIPKNGFIPMRMAQPSGLDGYPAGKHQPTNGTAPALTKLNGKNDTRANYRGDKTSNQPDQARQHATSAATITFFEAATALSFYQSSRVGSGFTIRGHRLSVCHNRRKTSEAQTMPHKTTVHGQLSRVVLVSGPRDLLHLPSLFNYFEERFYFPINRIVAFTGDGGYDTYEIRFASFYCQSEMAVMTIEREKTFKEMGMRIEYARDPCDVAVMQHQILAPVGNEARGDEVKAEEPTADQAWTDRWDKATLAWNAQEDWEAAS